MYVVPDYNSHPGNEQEKIKLFTFDKKTGHRLLFKCHDPQRRNVQDCHILLKILVTNFYWPLQLPTVIPSSSTSDICPFVQWDV